MTTNNVFSYDINMKFTRLLYAAFKQIQIAQHIHNQSISKILPHMINHANKHITWKPSTGQIRFCIKVAARLSSLFGKSLDSCIIRSLAFAALANQYNDVVIHIGFHRSANKGALHEGHAWVTINNNFGILSGMYNSNTPYTISQSIALNKYKSAKSHD